MAQQGLLLDGAAQHPFGQCGDVAGLLGHRDEGVRRKQAEGRVLPADQRLEGHRQAGRELDDRLVVHAELAPLDGQLEVGL